MRENLSKKLHGKSRVTLNSFINLKGKVKSRISNKLREYARGLEDLNKDVIPLNDKLRDSLNQLMVDYENISKTMATLAEISSKLYDAHKEFNSKVEFGKTIINQNIYGGITHTFKSLGSYFTERIDTLRQSIFKQVKYTKHEIFGLNEVIFLVNLADQNEE